MSQCQQKKKKNLKKKQQKRSMCFLFGSLFPSSNSSQQINVTQILLFNFFLRKKISCECSLKLMVSSKTRASDGDAQSRETINWLARAVRVVREELRDLKRPPGSGKYWAATESELAESSRQFSVDFGETRPPGATTESELAESSRQFSVDVGEARPPGDTTESEPAESSGAFTTDIDEALLPGIAKHSATPVAKSVGDGEARPPGNAKYSATAKSVLSEPPAELHEEAGPSWSRASGTSSADVSAVAKPVDEARPPEITKYTATEIAKAVADGEAQPPGIAKVYGHRKIRTRKVSW